MKTFRDGLLSSIKNLPYSERLEALRLPCLEHRLQRGDLIDTYKYVHGLCRVSKPCLFSTTGLILKD
jgi:hypothetical protein